MAICVMAAVVIAEPAVANGDVVSIQGDAKASAWWLRTSFHPSGKDVMGLPISQIRSDWCAANELTLELFPQDARSDPNFPLDRLMNELGLSFAISGRFDGVRDLAAIIGVFQTCSGSQGTFLLTGQANPKRVVAVETIAKQAQFSALQAEGQDGVNVWECFACDGIARYRWRASQGRFTLQPTVHFQ
jgi:hypothetical protein